VIEQAGCKFDKSEHSPGSSKVFFSALSLSVQ